MIISCSIDYWSDDVLTFDPEKVVNKLAELFPEIQVDPTDRAAAEVERFQLFVDCREDITPETRETVLRQIAGKARRNGPGFNFQLGNLKGQASRYSVYFMADEPIDEEMRTKLIDFLKSLKYGTVNG